MMLTPNLAGVPRALQGRPQWVLWRAEGEDPENLDKVPYHRFGYKASSTKPETWAPFDGCTATLAHSPEAYTGLGYVFSADDPFVGIDLDDCRDPETGEIADWARAILDTVNSYSEVSPSGTGIKIWVYGQLAKAVKTATVELYSERRYFTVTGRRLEEYPAEPVEAQAAIDALVERYAPPRAEREARASGAVRSGGGVRLSRYAEAALQGEVDTVAAAGEGTRNDTLNTAAFNLGQIVAAGLLSEADVFEALDAAAARAGLGATESERTIRSGMRAGMGKPRIIKDRPLEQPRQPARGEAATAAGANDEAPLPPGSFHRTDLGNARRLINEHGEDLRYVPAWGCWLVWNGRHWERDEDGATDRRARQVIDGMYHEAADEEDPDTRRALVKWAMRSEGRGRLEAMVALAAREPGVPVLHERLNGDPDLLTVANGTIDLRTGELGPHRRAHLITKTLAVEYDPQAACPVWDAFLQRALAGDDELITFVQRAVGYTLTADTREQCLFFLYGTGRNGKSTFIETLLELLGIYAQKAPTEMLMARPMGAGIPNDVAQLPGRRFVVTAETEEGRRLNESLVKDLTGGDRMTARFMRAEFFEFKPTHKLWMYGNHKPVIRGTDLGIWRRIRAIPFTVTIPEAEVDEAMPARLRQELPGILAWAVRGCLAWRRSGLGESKAVSELTEFYRAEMDVLGAFIDERCVTHPNARAEASALYKAYQQWAEGAGEHVYSHRRFGTQLTERGFGRHKDGAGRIVRLGIGLRADDRDPPSPGSTDKRTITDEDPVSPHVHKSHGGNIDVYPYSSVRPYSEESKESEETAVAESHAAGVMARLALLKEQRNGDGS
jgi:putative DNA primase/helicase